MSGELVDVSGRDSSGTTEYIFYRNADGTYTLLGSANTPLLPSLLNPS